MEDNKNVKKGKRLVKTVEQAKTVLDRILRDTEKLKLERGMAELLDKLKNPNLDVVMDRYPELVQEYELERLLSGELEIPHAETSDVRTAGVFICLQLLIHFCEELKGNPNPGEDFYESLRYILGAISSDKLVHELLLIIISVVGIEYYEKFKQRIQDVDSDLESVRRLEYDHEVQEHLELMAWFALIRLFIESVYIHFNNPDHNFKKHIV